jgi:hypothetical protein
LLEWWKDETESLEYTLGELLEDSRTGNIFSTSPRSTVLSKNLEKSAAVPSQEVVNLGLNSVLT